MNKKIALEFLVIAILIAGVGEILASQRSAAPNAVALQEATTTTRTTTSTISTPNLGWGQPLGYTLIPQDGILYGADGTKIVKEMVYETSTTTSTLVDVKKNVLAFDISRDGSWLAYSVRMANPGPDPNQAGISKAGNGDTVILRSLSDSREFTLYSDPHDKNFEIKSVKFSPDGNYLFFSNNFLGIVDLNSKKIMEYNDHGMSSNCPTQAIQDVSNDGSKVLLFTGCSEGSYQQIFDVNTKAIVQVPGYVGEGSWAHTVQGFVNDRVTIGSYQSASGTEAMLYDESAKPLKAISGPIQESMPIIDDTSDPSQVFFGLYTNIPVERAIDVYTVNRDTLEIRKTDETKRLIVNDGSGKRWLTNNHLENPILIPD